MAKPFDRRALAVSGASSHGSWAPSRRAGRTAVLGGHVEQCDDCGATRIAYNSCRNRHCPECQGLARAKWLADRQAELLPVPYFHVVFTLPAPLGEIAFQNKAAVYAILFRAAAETLAIIAADSRHLGAQLGMAMVLHTWGQTLQHHPHVHCVVPGGRPSLDGTRWVACRSGFFLPVRALCRTASIASATTVFSPMAPAVTASLSVVGCSKPVSRVPSASLPTITPEAIARSPLLTSPSVLIAVAPCGGSQSCHAPATHSHSPVTRHDVPTDAHRDRARSHTNPQIE
jgi:hypothetical protein